MHTGPHDRCIGLQGSVFSPCSLVLWTGNFNWPSLDGFFYLLKWRQPWSVSYFSQCSFQLHGFQCCFVIGCHQVSQANLNLTETLLFQPPKCWLTAPTGISHYMYLSLWFPLIPFYNFYLFLPDFPELFVYNFLSFFWAYFKKFKVFLTFLTISKKKFYFRIHLNKKLHLNLPLSLHNS